MRFFFASFRKDLARWRRDRLAFLLWLGIPFMIGGLITLMMAGGNAKPHGILLLADEDQSFISRAFANAFQQEGLADLITVVPVTKTAGLTRIDKGKGSALLVIPAGFGERVFKQEPTQVILRKNPSQTILPGIIQETVEILLDAGFYLQAVFGEDLKTVSDWIEGGRMPEGAVIGNLADAVRARFEAAGAYLDPLALEVKVAEEKKKNEPEFNLALLFLPGIMLMSAMFSMQGLAGDLWAERQQGTLRRLWSSPQGLLGYFLGKVAAAGVIVGLLAAIIIAAGFSYHGIALAHVPSTLLWMILSGVALFCWFTALQLMAPSRQSAAIITTILLFPLLMTGGSFFPMEIMPAWLQAIGRLSPNGFMVSQLSVELTAAHAWAIAPEKWGVLLAIGGSGLVLSVLLLGFGFARRQGG